MCLHWVCCVPDRHSALRNLLPFLGWRKRSTAPSRIYARGVAQRRVMRTPTLNRINVKPFLSGRSSVYKLACNVSGRKEPPVAEADAYK